MPLKHFQNFCFSVNIVGEYLLHAKCINIAQMSFARFFRLFAFLSHSCLHFALSNCFFCWDIDGLSKELRIHHGPKEWRLFIDDSKLSLKAVLLSNRNKLTSIAVAHVVYMKETYHNLKPILEMINCAGCQLNRDCAANKVCMRNQCKNPCSSSSTCGTNATCSVINHLTYCTCLPEFIGDPFLECSRIKPRDA